MKAGILQTGRVPDNLKGKHGDYDEFFKRFLGGRGFSFTTYAALDGELPDQPTDADGWLITGSKFSVYEDHGWISALESFLRDCFAADVPIVGICFGHQILAQALGGKVEKFSGGWAAGLFEYESRSLGRQSLIAWHQDQVTRRAKNARVIASSIFCKNALLAYENKALTIQPHPEFTAGYLADLIEARRDVLPAGVAASAKMPNNQKITSAHIAQLIEHFLKSRDLPGTII